MTTDLVCDGRIAWFRTVPDTWIYSPAINVLAASFPVRDLTPVEFTHLRAGHLLRGKAERAMLLTRARTKAGTSSPVAASGNLR